MFRLNRLDLHNHKVLGSLRLNFVKTYSKKESPFISVMIGVNGIGKSQVLRVICEIFNYILSISNNTQNTTEPYFDFKLSYTIDNREMELSKKQISKFDRQKLIDVLPKHLIATSNYVLDKFPTQSNSMYKYCGIRNENTPGLVSTKGLIRKTVDWVLKSLDEKTGFKNEICHLLRVLRLSQRLTLTYSMRHKDIFLSRDMSRNKLIDIYRNQKKYFIRRKNDFWGTEAFRAIEKDSDKLDLIVDFLRRKSDPMRYFHPNRIEYELLGIDNALNVDRSALGLLNKIGILSYPKLTVYKSQNPYDFAESSSGETTLLCQYLSIMSNIRDNSLILIDEPEQSSHPNWQINYLKWLREIFHDYYSCHFIISTHSHFLLSDLDPEDSSLIVLDYNKNGKVEDRGSEITPFCWSSDDILYRVFKVRNTRNSVFETRMMRLYKLLQFKENNIEEIRKLVEELKGYRLNEDDPLIHLLNIAERDD